MSGNTFLTNDFDVADKIAREGGVVMGMGPYECTPPNAEEQKLNFHNRNKAIRARLRGVKVGSVPRPLLGAYRGFV